MVYSLILNEATVELNDYIGKSLEITFTGKIYCIQCGRKTSRSFQQGHCYPCMQRLAECNYCIIHPEKCNVVHGPCPENDWAHAQCSQPHIVYLANSSGLKVGITRQNNTDTRWIDQGASQALPIFKVANRYQSGAIEVCLKQFINDKTDWRKMIKQSAPPIDLIAERDRLWALAKNTLQPVLDSFSENEILFLPNEPVVALEFPVNQYPPKIITWSFDTTETISGKLQGIKGQYLLFEAGVINVRKFSGYEIKLKME
ncbi:MAG: DUF2797 domain-containing protein [Proteobacteria bacterium]|nr:DUF2797 domain-containing protein [Pseudomonadota bacterium]